MSTITREFTKEQLRQIIEIDHVQCGEASALARIALASLEAEPVAWMWERDGVRDVDMDNPDEGVNRIGARKALDAGWIFKPLYTAPPAPVSVPDDGREQFEAWFKFHHGDEHSIVTLHRANGGLNYRDPHVDLAWIAWKDSRAAMLQGGEPVTTAYNFPGDFESFISWLTGGNGIPDWLINGDKIDDEKVSFLLKVYRAGAHGAGGNSPVIPDGWVACSELMPEDNAEQEVLACFKGGDISTLYYFEGRWDDAYGIVPIRQDVTHWMPLPAAPQQEVK